jgi:hypothetical protein
MALSQEPPVARRLQVGATRPFSRSISPSIVLWAVLKSARHRACGIAAAISDIEINAVAAAGYRTSIPTTITALSRSLILRGYHAVRVTAAADVKVIPMSAVLNLAQDVALVRRGCAKVSGDSCSCEGDDHVPVLCSALNIHSRVSNVNKE